MTNPDRDWLAEIPRVEAALRLGAEVIWCVRMGRAAGVPDPELREYLLGLAHDFADAMVAGMVDPPATLRRDYLEIVRTAVDHEMTRPTDPDPDPDPLLES